MCYARCWEGLKPKGPDFVGAERTQCRRLMPRDSSLVQSVVWNTGCANFLEHRGSEPGWMLDWKYLMRMFCEMWCHYARRAIGQSIWLVISHIIHQNRLHSTKAVDLRSHRLSEDENKYGHANRIINKKSLEYTHKDGKCDNLEPRNPFHSTSHASATPDQR
jgi:hypothetical protein